MLKKAISFLPFIAVLFFLPALTGPLLLDDTIHLGPIQSWLTTGTGTYELIFHGQSGPFGRPLSLLTFMLNAMTTGEAILPMKATNLLLHLATGLCLAALFYRLFKRDSNLAAQTYVASIAAASLWLVLPQHIATVFYVIQRMTELAALFAVIACWFYVVLRERIERDEKKYLAPLSGIIFFTILSVLSKETGLFIPLYCLLIELVYFRPTAGKPRPLIISWSFRLGVIFPCLMVATYLAITPEFVLGPYVDRPFTMPERTITQLSVLADYFASTFLPMTRSAGVFNDDFPISQSLSANQLLILLTGIGLIIAAIRMRKNYPGFTAGIGIFFIGHMLESSIFSLEIYFVHRNYMPSMGLVLGLFGLVAGLFRRYPTATESLRKMLPIVFGALFSVYAISSLSRAQLWSNNASLMVHAQIKHPTSSRLRSELLLNALYAKRLDVALSQADMAMQTSPPNEKRTIQLWKILAYCYAEQRIPKGELETFQAMPSDRITLATSTALGYVASAAEANACPDLDRKQLGKLASQWAVHSVQYPESFLVWKTHFAAARLLASGGDLAAALKQAEWAFKDSGYDFSAGILAYQLANSLENTDRAEATMALLVANERRYSQEQQFQIRALLKQ
ncbi:MAG: hypothetical protein ABI644_11890 [Arenimonas sp.]